MAGRCGFYVNMQTTLYKVSFLHVNLYHKHLRFFTLIILIDTVILHHIDVLLLSNHLLGGGNLPCIFEGFPYIDFIMPPLNSGNLIH